MEYISWICVAVGILLLVLVLFLVVKIYSILWKIPNVPTVDEHLWWGVGTPSPDADVSIKPFRITVSDKDLTELKLRLSMARPIIQSLEGLQHQFGLNSNLLTEVTEFWQNKYDWHEQETFLNQHPQYTTKIQGLNIHFLHVKPNENNREKVIPILILHGWPSCVREYYEALPLLVSPNKNRNFVFEVVVPHLPGYGFSDAASRPGLNPTRIAVIMKLLMSRLGFDQWYVQGGDWGSEVGTHMAILYPKNVLGLHVNMALVQTPKARFKIILGSIFPCLVVSSKHRSKMYPLKEVILELVREMGYFLLQATRPDTVGVALSDSPIGLAAYILEKYIVWTNRDYLSREDGGLALKYNYNKLLDIIMIYWISNSITSSMRLYAESFNSSNKFRDIAKIPVKVPSAYAQFCNDMLYTPKSILKEKFKKLLQVSENPTGGHFPALEDPQLFADDVANAIEKFEKYHNKYTTPFVQPRV